MTSQNAPSGLLFEPPTAIPDDRVSDYIDGKLRRDTPEEYVRQNIEKRLVGELRYQKGQVKVEFPLNVGSTKPRADLVVFPTACEDRDQNHVVVVIECKAAEVDPSARKDGVAQLQS